ncbi:glycosyltransferase [Vibrio harveyi]|uniref:glycosyltransferase n=1 Tax=Vibrio harveyi TaxID=669 RepID=UPI0040677970
MSAKVLIFSHYFYPCYQAGGPVRSLANLTAYLEGDVDFDVITSAADLDGKKLHNIHTDRWVNTINSTKVYYCSNMLSVVSLQKDIDVSQYDVVYLNSFFDFKYTILPLLFLKISNYKGRILIAPRGELSFGAIKFGENKKRLYTRLFCKFFENLNIKFHFTSIEERKEAIDILPKSFSSILVPNMHEKFDVKHSGSKIVNKLSMIYLSRVCDKKNLYTALKSLQFIPSHQSIVFTIAGPIDSDVYWSKCLTLIENMPEHIIVNVVGSLDRHATIQALSQNEAFILPTYNENFGHAIVEACSLGCIPIISNKTPWSEVSKHGGFVCEPDDYQSIARSIETISSYDYSDYNASREMVVDFFKVHLNNNERLVKEMFENV